MRSKESEGDIMAYVCGACRCQSCKLNGEACKEVKDICKECNGNNPPKCKYGKQNQLDTVLGSIEGKLGNQIGSGWEVKPMTPGPGLTVIRDSRHEIKVDETDMGCCAADCSYKNGNYCRLYNEKLIGCANNPTRCPECNSY